MAIYDLGLTSSEFWELTPAQFQALLKRQEMHESLDDYRSAQIACILVNVNRKSGSKASEVTEFMPTFRDKTKKEMTPEEIMNHLKSISK